MIPNTIVFNTNMHDKNGNALPVGQGDNLDDLLSVYHGKAYQIMKVKTEVEKGNYFRNFV
ncbi:hypothetical protein [Weissella paramesenteroides]|uniref:hypothetical protein n=1 Tax=Weissella paramesenteroides TaxID=1249 RepID=UPI00123927C1|nr:hypothetical protein [Weissella paramesenteroides]KAA8446952.1 hypothetical protein FKV72_03935 [Weissella paramesenteroides]KAA8450588.1 hypothetical protein FKV71_08625 [Weissella paramesenteroides]